MKSWGITKWHITMPACSENNVSRRVTDGFLYLGQNLAESGNHQLPVLGTVGEVAGIF